jgi:hypothetical protein
MRLARGSRDRPAVVAEATAVEGTVAVAKVASEEATRNSEPGKKEIGQGWIRTSEGVKPADLQSAPFGHFGTYPFECERFI